MEKTRNNYTGEEKVAILRRRLLENEQGLQPPVFYRWQKEFVENRAADLQSKAQASHQPEQAPDRVSGEKGRTIGQLVPRDFWLADSEKKATIDFHGRNPLEEYRRLTFMMIDQCMISGLPVEVCFANIVAVSPSSVWRVLPQAGLSSKWQGQPSKKGSGFEQPLKPMNIGISTFATSNIGGTFLLPVQRARWLLERS